METNLAKTDEMLSPKEELYCSNYTAIGTPTFGFKERSAVAAGFSEKSARNTATKLMKRPEINQRISELNAENMSRNNINTDKVLSDIEHTRLLALEKQDLTNARECSNLQGKFLALWRADRPVESPSERTTRSQKESQAIQELVEVWLNSKYNTLPADSDETNENFRDEIPHVPQTAGA